MRFAIATAALVAGAAAADYGYGYPPVVPQNTTSVAPPVYTPPAEYVTITTSEYVTYCPGSTEVEVGTKTYTVTEATTLTVPCHKTCVIKTYPAGPVESSKAPVYSQAPPVKTSVAPYPTGAPAPAPYPTGTAAPSKPIYPTGGAPKPSTPAPFEGAATKQTVGLLAVVGALAAFL